MNTAERLSRVPSLVVGEPARLQVRAWDETVAGPAGAPLFDALVARVGCGASGLPPTCDGWYGWFSPR
ncbi:MAG: hypothetical protein LH461_03350 [Spirochaetaceae bacterium]|nr:hypothetical protein [Spirochaetaceae bacterium]